MSSRDRERTRKGSSSRKARERRRKQARRKRILFLTVAAAIFIAIIGGVLMLLGVFGKGTDSANGETIGVEKGTEIPTVTTEEQDNQDAQESTELSFPLELETGKMTVNSVFQSSIPNPDCDNESAEDIASLEIMNSSTEFIIEADLTMVMTDGTSYSFTLENLPAGKMIWVFDQNNQSLSENQKCKQIRCDSIETTTDPTSLEKVNVTSEGNYVTVTNISSEDLENVKIYFHGMMDETYLGGKGYSVVLESLEAGDDSVLEIDDCILGELEAVRIVEE